MKQKLKTSISFAKNIFETGALTETSRKVEIEICSKIPTKKDIIVIEFGMGHGNITKEILKTISPNSKLYAFEINPDFCEHVKNTISDNRLIIVNDSAINLKKHINKSISNVIGSIPFSFFSHEKSLEIIQNSYDLLEEKGYYSQVLYTKHNFKKFQSVFDSNTIKRLSLFPLEYIYHCQKLS